MTEKKEQFASIKDHHAENQGGSTLVQCDYCEARSTLTETRVHLADAQFNHEKARVLQAHAQHELHIAVGQIGQYQNELTTIKSTWYYRFGTSPLSLILPFGSRRRRLAKFIYFSLRHPFTVIRNIKPGKLRALYKSLVFTEPVPISEARSDDIVYEEIIIPKYSYPIVSIIIPAYNEFSYTYSCLKSIRDNTSLPYEVILADDCSTDQTKEITSIVRNIVHIRNEKNMRFLLNCNNAAKHAKGEYLFFLNNDTQVQSGWLNPLVELMNKDSNVGLIGSKLIYPDGRLQEAGGIIWNDCSGWNYGRYEDPERPEYNYVKDVDYISGAAIMVRKSVWDEVGGFDERFSPAYFEDVDLAFSIRKMGMRTVYQPESVVIHYEGISHGTDTSQGQKQYQIENAKKFYERWKNTLIQEHFPNGENVFNARDRSRNKKTILFIDHYVPMYNQDAGSRNIFSYVKLFVDMGYNVLFLGDNFTPHQPYTLVLQQMGVEVLFGSWYQENWMHWLETNGMYIDYVFSSRSPITEKYIDALRQYTTARIMYYVVDLVYVRLRAQYEIEQDKKLLDDARQLENIEKKLFSQVDVILTVSTAERDIINADADINTPIVVFPIFFYDSFKDITPFDNRKDLLFVGGFQHPPNVDAVLWLVHEVMPRLPEEIRLIVVGSKTPESVHALASERIIVKGFVSDEELSDLYTSCRIAVIPLRFGAGVKGKTIEAIYNLIPVVSTSFGIEGLSEVSDILSPFDNAESFANEVIRLYSSDCECETFVREYNAWLNKWFSKASAIQAINEMTGSEG